MLQIVGTWCAVCRERITSDHGATFCQDCGGPHHTACVSAVVSNERCPTCGGDQTHPFVIKYQELLATATWAEARQREAKAAKVPGVGLFTVIFALVGIGLYQVMQAVFFPKTEPGYDAIRILLAALVGAIFAGFGPMIGRAMLRQQPPTDHVPPNDQEQSQPSQATIKPRPPL